MDKGKNKDKNELQSAYAVIFTAQRTHDDTQEAYAIAAKRMEELAQTMPGYLGFVSTRDENGFGITISYWESEDAIKAWRDNLEHSAVRERGRDEWYLNYNLQVAKIERSYAWNKLENNNE